MNNVYTVREVNSYIENMFNHEYLLKQIYVKGEVSNCKYHTSGHIYFSLKDESGMISCVMFAGSRAGLSFRLQNGQGVIALGKITVYKRDGKYQLVASEIRQDGIGVLYERFEALKKELSDMGMFAPEYKRPIPKYVKRVGIVTAPTGAAVKDIMNVAGRRNPYVQLILYPALVQGEGSAESVVRGIRALDKENVDVIIVGRGGGSYEDLWTFNEEAVVYAIFECRTPIISAVGHDIDVTISDFVADLSAPTPSAAAELAVYDVREVKRKCASYRDALQRRMTMNLTHYKNLADRMNLKLRMMDPWNKINENRQYLSDLETKLRDRMQERLVRERHRLAIYLEKMKGHSPLLKLNQGYSYVQTPEGKNINRISQVQAGDQLEIFVTDGLIHTEVTHKEEKNV